MLHQPHTVVAPVGNFTQLRQPPHRGMHSPTLPKLTNQHYLSQTLATLMANDIYMRPLFSTAQAIQHTNK